jgi:hypothetical protein
LGYGEELLGNFYVTGRVERSHKGRSFKIYMLAEDGKWIFVGLISRDELGRLLRGEIEFGSICKYSDSGKPTGKMAAQETLPIKLADPEKLGSLNYVT